MFEGPLFLIGAPRSGTKLLMRLLNNHPGILLANEFGALGSILTRWKGKDLSDPNIFARMYRDLTGTIYYVGNMKKYDLDIEQEFFYRSLTEYTIEEAMAWFIRQSASFVEGKSVDSKLWGQKSPHLTDRAGLLKEHYPEARFIHIVRDVRNCALSSMQAWNTDILRYSQRWYQRVESAEEQLDEMESEDRHTLRYEDLTAYPEESMKAIYDFLELEFNPDYIRLKSPSENYGNAKGRKEILKQDDRKYEKQVSKKDLEKIERITFPLLEKFDYPYSYRGRQKMLSPLTMKVLQARDIYHRMLFDIREKGWSQIIYILKLKLGHFKKI